MLLLGRRDDHCPGGQGAGEGAGPFKTSDLGALGTTDSCPAGEEDDKICAKLQNSAHLGSVGIFQGPPRGETQTPPCPAASPGLYLLMCGFHVFHPEIKDEGGMLWKVLFLHWPLSGVVLGTASHFRICFLLWRQEWNRASVPVPGSHWFNAINYLVENLSPSQRRWCRCCQAQGTANASSPISLAVAVSAFFQASNEFVERGQVRRRL